MNRRILDAIAAIVLLCQSAWVIHTQTTAKPAGALNMISGKGGNVAVDVTSEGVLLVFTVAGK